MTSLIGTGKIVGLIELSSDYLYDFYSFSNKMTDFSIIVQNPPFVLIPHGGWRSIFLIGLGEWLFRKSKKSCTNRQCRKKD